MNFQHGDMLEVVGIGPRHVGIYVQGGFVIHNSKSSRIVEYTNLHGFASGRRVRVLWRVNGSWFEQEKVVRRAASLIGMQYDLLKFNCEHAAYYALTGEPRSPQIAGWTFLAFMVGLLFAGAKSR